MPSPGEKKWTLRWEQTRTYTTDRSDSIFLNLTKFWISVILLPSEQRNLETGTNYSLSCKWKKKIKQRPCGFTQARYKGETIKQPKLKKTTTLAYKSGKKRTVEQAKMWINQCLCGQLVNLMLSDTSQRSRIPVVWYIQMQVQVKKNKNILH